MKKINIPLSRTFTATINLSKLMLSKEEFDKREGTVENGVKWVNGGTILETKPLNDLLDVARENGGKVIWATTCIEQVLDEIISDYLFGTVNEGNIVERKYFFDMQILATPTFTFAAKKGLVKSIIERKSLLKGEKKSSLENLLRKIMDFRNAFAHGDIIVDRDNGCILKFYLGTQQSVTLDDKYWDDLEEVFKQADSLLKEIKTHNKSIQRTA